jgi:hypothetical protein
MKRGSTRFFAYAAVFAALMCGACSDPTGSSPGTTPAGGGSGTIPDVVKFVAPEIPATGSCFANAVAIDGDYMVIGDFCNGDNVRGLAWVYHRTGPNAWDSGVKLVAPDAHDSDYFGYSVAISGDRVIIGAVFVATAGLSDSGAAYVFTRTGTNSWDSGVRLVATDPAADDQFGVAVSISGDYAAVAAPSKGDGGLPDTGAVYVFHRTGNSTWDAGTKIAPGTLIESNRFGIAIGISGDYLIVGVLNTHGVDTRTGSAYIFKRTALNSWDAGTIITATDPAAGARFGRAVAIDGDNAIVGADNAGGSYIGAAYIFTRTASGWDSGIKIVASDAEADVSFGCSIAIKGDCAIVGALDKEISATLRPGCAYIFRKTAGAWDAGQIFIVSDAPNYSCFGHTVAISSEYAVAGAPYASDPTTGHGWGTGYVKYIKQ